MQKKYESDQVAMGMMLLGCALMMAGGALAVSLVFPQAYDLALITFGGGILFIFGGMFAIFLFRRSREIEQALRDKHEEEAMNILDQE